MTETSTQDLTAAELAILAEQLRCPDGMRNPFNSVPLPRGRKALLVFVVGMLQRRADSAAIERAGRC